MTKGLRDPATILMAGSLPLAAPWNGADKIVARTIVEADAAHRYIVQTGPSDAWPSHVEPVRVADPAMLPSGAAGRAAARYLLAATSGADLIHLVATRRRAARPMARLLRAWSRVTGRPIVHTLPALGGDGLAEAPPLGDVTVVFSRHTAARLHAAGVDDVVTLFPPVSLGAAPGSAAVEALRARHDLGPRPILYPAHLDPGSGIRDAILALAALPPELDDVTLVLPVRWRTGQDPSVAIGELKGFARAVGVGARLRWFTEPVDMPSLITACHLTALVPERLDGKMDLPLVLLESLALGRPIVVADIAPLNEALLDGGLAVPSGRTHDLTAAFTRLLTDAALHRRLGSTGLVRVRTLAEPTRVAETYGEIYGRLLDRRPARVPA